MILLYLYKNIFVHLILSLFNLISMKRISFNIFFILLFHLFIVYAQVPIRYGNSPLIYTRTITHTLTVAPISNPVNINSVTPWAISTIKDKQPFISFCSTNKFVT